MAAQSWRSEGGDGDGEATTESVATMSVTEAARRQWRRGRRCRHQVGSDVAIAMAMAMAMAIAMAIAIAIAMAML